MFTGQFMFFDESFNIITAKTRENGLPTDRLRLNTILFHTFMLMNIINMINCRVVGDMNIVKTLFNNKFFWLVFVFEMVVQNAMIYFANDDLFSVLLGTAPLSVGMQITCWILALLVLGVRAGAQKIPIEKLNFMAKVDLENENDNANLVTRGLKKWSDTFERMKDMTKEE